MKCGHSWIEVRSVSGVVRQRVCRLCWAHDPDRESEVLAAARRVVAAYEGTCGRQQRDGVLLELVGPIIQLRGALGRMAHA